ncbi:MAG: helicase C-terminal domain-containing protein, partial [Rhodospirillales bacterium]|nr:helicase C-terminal domain-containing protein [Rhodospirillales bacterium]
WASTVHAFQGRTVDNVIAAMEANHAKLTTQKSFYVEISRARDRAELVTDDRNALRETLEAVTGERIAALEAVEAERDKGREAELDSDRSVRREDGGTQARQRERASGDGTEKARAPKIADREFGL